MAKTKEEIRELLQGIQTLPHFSNLMERTEDHICGELDINASKLVQAIIDDDIDAVVNAFTGWDVEGLLFYETSPLHRFARNAIPPKEGAPVHTPPADGKWKFEDYTWEYCPECDSDQVIYSKGITACPNCGAPLAPCSCCEDGCDYNRCPYGCTGTEEDSFKTVTNPQISAAEQEWFMEEENRRTNAYASNASAAKAAENSPHHSVSDEAPICDCPYRGTDLAYECPSYGHGVCFEGSPCDGLTAVCDSEEAPTENPTVDEDDADDGEFECIYNCQECEISGSCERQEHLNEVDNEVDAL